MKNKYPIYKLVSFILLITFISISCNKITDPTDGMKIIISYDLIKTRYNVEFYDAKTGNLIGENTDTPIHVSFTGPNSEDIITTLGVKEEIMYSANGKLEFGLDPAVGLSANNPAAFTIVAKLQGYISTSRLIVTPSEGSQIIKIFMVDRNNLPEGVSYTQDWHVETDPQGVVQQDVTIEIPGAVRLFIPAGIVIKDENGEPLQGMLGVNLYHFNSQMDESRQAFPGGFFVSAEQENGETEYGYFKTAGFVSLDITDPSGKEGKILEEKTIQMTGVLDPAVVNPNTEQVVADGDNIEMWSYEESTGEWQYEDTEVVTSAEGVLEVTSELNHLSWWNWDWWWWWWYCPDGLEIYFDIYEEYCPCFTVEAEIRDGYDNTLIMRSWIPTCAGDPVALLNMPAQYPVNINFSGDCGGMIWEEEWEYYDNICDIDELYYWFYTEPIGATIDVFLEGQCNTKTPPAIVLPTFGVWFRATDEYCWRWAQMINGHAEICNAEVGKTYLIEVYLNDEMYEYEVFVDQTNYTFSLDLPYEVCVLLGL